MSARTLIFSPASLLIDHAGNGVRPVLPTLDLAWRREAEVILLWDGPSSEAGTWAAEVFHRAPFVARPRGEWEEEVRRLSASGDPGGKPVTVGIGDSPADLSWLSAVDNPYLVGARAPGVRAVPAPAGYGWRLAVEEALYRAGS